MTDREIHSIIRIEARALRFRAIHIRYALVFGSFRGRALLLRNLEVQHLLLDGKIELAQWVQPNELMALCHNVEGLPLALGQQAHLVGSQTGDDASVFDDTFCADDDHVDFAEGVCNGGVGDRGDGDVVRAEIGDGLVAFFEVRGLRAGEDIDDAEAHGARLGGAAEQRTYDSGTPVGEHRRAVADEVLPETRNLLPALLCAVYEQASVGQEVVSYRAEVVAWA